MVRLGLIAFANNGGLAVQTQRLAKMLKPDRILVIDSSSFSKNKEHDFTFFKDYEHFITQGFPKNHEILKFIDGLTHVLTVENPYNFYLIHACREKGIKTYCQTNYEFCENVFAPHLPVPDLFLMPSYWMIEEMKSRFGEKKVIYLPPPTSLPEFVLTRSVNAKRKKTLKKKFLHIVGTLAFRDRNGTLDLLDALQLSQGDFKLVIRSQHELPEEYIRKDSRIEYRITNVKKNSDLYKGFDALILPRRYGGLSLTTNEALVSGLPVMMTDISPNDRLLPKKWLIPAVSVGEFQARAMIKYYSSDLLLLAGKIDEWASMDLSPLKREAFEIGASNFSFKALEYQYKDLFV